MYRLSNTMAAAVLQLSHHSALIAVVLKQSLYKQAATAIAEDSFSENVRAMSQM